MLEIYYPCALKTQLVCGIRWMSQSHVGQSNARFCDCFRTFQSRRVFQHIHVVHYGRKLKYMLCRKISKRFKSTSGPAMQIAGLEYISIGELVLLQCTAALHRDYRHWQHGKFGHRDVDHFNTHEFPSQEVTLHVDIIPITRAKALSPSRLASIHKKRTPSVHDSLIWTPVWDVQGTLQAVWV